MGKAFDNFLAQYENMMIDPWRIDEHRGVYMEKQGNGSTGTFESASPIPVLPTAILDNVDSGIEKVELSFFKFGRERKIVTDRATAASRTTVVKLANDGLEVNTNNANSLVKYIADVIASNLDTIDHREAKSTMGWVGDRFVPYDPGIAFDGDEQFRHLYRAITKRGKLMEWTAFMRPLRKNLIFRMTMAASFASPLIERVGENPFVLHLWGGTSTGKTVALMAAMSVWGDPAPGKLTRTLNMTQNSMLTTAAFLGNLPFAGDELQTIKSQWTNYDQLIMRLTEGQDRARMNRDRINEVKSWRCSFLFTGEEPCIKQSSGGGAKNRVIEIETKGTVVDNGNTVANFVRSNYGTAGERFVREIIKIDCPALYADLFRSILSAADTTDKQAGAMALLLLADRIASKLFWEGEDEIRIDQITQFLSSSEEVDVAERAYQFVTGSIAEHANNFIETAREVWGRIVEDTATININVLRRILTEAGFEWDAVKARWSEKGYLLKDGSGKFTQTTRVYGQSIRCAAIRLPEDQADPDELPL